MKRRDFIIGTAAALGVNASRQALAQMDPCPPPSFGAEGGTSASTQCTPSSMPEWLESSGIRSWLQLQSPAAAGVSPQPALPGSVVYVTNAWCGAAVRHSGSYFLLHGGGHADYSGNEIYALKLSDDSPKWQRLWGPTPLNQILEQRSHYADGNPTSVHTYYSNQYDQQGDRFLRIGSYSYWRESGRDNKVNAWRWQAANWDPDGTIPAVPLAAADYGPGVTSDATTGNVYFWGDTGRAIWTRSTGQWQAVTSGGSHNGTYSATAFDPVGNCVWSIGGRAATSGIVRRWDLATGTISNVSVTGTAASQYTSGGQFAMEYCPLDGKFYLYSGNSCAIFDASARTISTLVINGTAPLTPSSYRSDTQAIFNKFRYVPELKGFVVLPAWSAPTFFFRVA